MRSTWGDRACGPGNAVRSGSPRAPGRGCDRHCLLPRGQGCWAHPQSPYSEWYQHAGLFRTHLSGELRGRAVSPGTCVSLLIAQFFCNYRLHLETRNERTALLEMCGYWGTRERMERYPVTIFLTWISLTYVTSLIEDGDRLN